MSEVLFGLIMTLTVALGADLVIDHALHPLAKPWIAGLVFLVAGLLLVALAIDLGG
jgi:uncharacterized membrane protein